MANRNIQDALLSNTTALTSSDGSVTSADFDLEQVAPGVVLEQIELVVVIDALLAAELNTADTLTILLQGGASAAPTTSLLISKVLTGTGSAIAETTYRFRLPPDCPRYVNVKATSAGSTGDMSDKNMTCSLRF